MNCLQCGKELINTPGRRPKQFCNSTCRSNYWNKAKKTNNLKFKVIVVPEPTKIPNWEQPKSSKIDIKIMPKGLSLQDQIDWKIKNENKKS